MKKNFFLSLVALGSFFLGAGFFIVEIMCQGFSSIHPELTSVAQWVVAISFIIAIIALTTLLWFKQRKSNFLLDDLAFVSSLLMGEGGALGLIVLVLVACGIEIPESMITALKHPTLGMMALGFLLMALFFAINCRNSILAKKGWLTVQTFCLSLLMISIVIGGGRLYILPVSFTASEICCWTAIVCLAVASVSVFLDRRKYDR